ncbi:MAG: translesion DNA synthesis-associated protein ImuA [Burkholderiaceae bacterium]
MGSTAVSSLSQEAQALAARMPHALWRADQTLAHHAATVSSGHVALDDNLPGRGWPSAVLIELLLQQNGIGEMQLLRPALQILATRRVVLVQPPHLPHIASWSNWDLPPERLLWIKAASSADALWSAEQVLRNGACGGLLLWQTQARPESLRRLHLAAQDTDMLFWVMRPLACAQDTSPSPLRLGLRPAMNGLRIDIVKQRGARREDPLFLPLQEESRLSHPTPSSHHALLDQPAPSPARTRDLPAALV